MIKQAPFKGGSLRHSMSRLKRGLSSLRLKDNKERAGLHELKGKENEEQEKESLRQQKKEEQEKERLRQQKKEKAILAFYDTIQKLGDHPTIHLTVEDTSSLGFIVEVEQIKLLNGTVGAEKEAGDKLEYFTPMPMQNYPINDDAKGQSKVMVTRYANLQECIDEGSQFHKRMGRTSLTAKPRCICSKLMYSVEAVPRIGTENDSRPLRVLTGWRLGDGYMVSPEFYPFLKKSSDPPYCYGDFWVKKGSFGPYPHIKMSMWHGNSEPVTYLLLGEFLAIVTIICTRMIDPDFDIHHIIPVMIFSCVGPNHARVIQSHFDENDNIMHIRMSELLDLSSKNKEISEAWETLTSYLAADVNLSADTLTPA